MAVYPNNPVVPLAMLKSVSTTKAHMLAGLSWCVPLLKLVGSAKKAIEPTTLG